MAARRWLVVGAVVLAVAAIAGWLWHRHESARTTNELVLYGNVDIRQVSLAFNGSDRIADLLVREGDRVRPGQVLGRLDTRALELRAQQARAQIGVQEQMLLRLQHGSRPQEIAEARSKVEAARADADLAVRSLGRLQSTSQSTGGRAVARLDIDNALARVQSTRAQLEAARKAADLVVAGPRREDVAQARAQLAAARAELALMEYQLSEGELKSPVQAVVRSRLMEPGDMASPQRPVYTLAITRPKWIRAYVAEPDLGRVKPGEVAGVRTDSAPGEELRGTVGYISSVAEFTPKTVQTEDLRTSLVYEVRINVDDPQDQLRLGMPVTVRLLPGAAEAR